MTTPAPSKNLHLALWLVQGLLAFAFFGAGSMKLFTPIDELARRMAWAREMPDLARFIGASELAGALGLLLPAATRIKPVLTPIAAACLALVMVLAVGFHVMKGDMQFAPATVLGALSAFVAWGRFKAAPIAAR